MHLIRQKESKKILKTTRDCGETNSKSDCNVNHTLDRLHFYIQITKKPVRRIATALTGVITYRPKRGGVEKGYLSNKTDIEEDIRKDPGLR